jgi:hypothetical protein
MNNDLFDDYAGSKVQIFRRPKGLMAPFEIVCKCGYTTTAMPFWVGKFPCAFCGEILLIPDDN